MMSSPWQFLVIVVIVFLVPILRRFTSRNSGEALGQALVAREVKINEEGPHYVHLVGRRPGLYSFILSIIGINPITTFDVYEDRIERSEGTLSGRVTHIIPMSAICNLCAGYSKPFALMILAGLFGLIAACCLIMAIAHSAMLIVVFILLVLIIVLVVVYYLKKTMFLHFLPASALGASMLLKRSIIEGVNIDENTAYKIVDIVSGLVDRNELAAKHEQAELADDYAAPEA